MNSMKGIIVAAIIIIALAISAFYFSSFSNPHQNQLAPSISPSQPSPAASAVQSTRPTNFDANDNLDQAIQDLNEVTK